MNSFIKKHRLKIVGLVVGAIVGYLYYYYVGCQSGTCAITSKPWNMTIYGSIMGLLLFDMFAVKGKSKSGNIDNDDIKQ